jgi:two-component system, chemotaxis family, protein-glutamate methylesterase/glutaminase
MSVRDIIVIGASAGGFNAIQRLVEGFPANLPAAVFVTLHVYGKGPGVMPDLLSRACPLPAANAVEGESIAPGRIYVAPPDQHLILHRGFVELGHGPRENMQRPCINAMFRSAAAAYGERVAGVLLTGLLDDGAAGLWEIQQHGGATVVQDPSEAEFRSMPESAIRGLNVQYILRLQEMALLLTRLTMSEQGPAPEDLLQPREEPAGQICPECGGVMTIAHMGTLREYRCHTSHRFGLRTLIAEKSRVVERALQVALSQSEELTGLLESAASHPDPQASGELNDEITDRKEEQAILRGLNQKERNRLAEACARRRFAA